MFLCAWIVYCVCVCVLFDWLFVLFVVQLCIIFGLRSSFGGSIVFAECSVVSCANLCSCWFLFLMVSMVRCSMQFHVLCVFALMGYVCWSV